MSTDYCSECEEERGCGNYHVYIIELIREVLEDFSRFPYDGDLPPDKKVFYVGYTAHSPECRYFQHTADQPEDKMFECTCFPDKPKKFKKRVKYIRNKEKRYDVGLLNWKKTLNPIVRVDGPTFHGSARQQKQTAMEFEQFLGETLRLAGHAVYWN